MTETHCYETRLKWEHGTEGILCSPNLPDQIHVATPPELPNGVKGKWTPEHLFVASINACLMATFLVIAENSKLEFISYESNANGTAEKVDGKFAFTEVTLQPTVTIAASQHQDKVRRMLEMSERACTIANSVKTKINLEPIISIA